MQQWARRLGLVLGWAWLSTGCCGNLEKPTDPNGAAGRGADVSTRPVTEPGAATGVAVRRAADAREQRLRNLRQLTFGGENAEAYFSADGKRLIFQSTRPPYDCDQIFTMNVDGSDVRLVSPGIGRTTCAYFYYPHDDRILFSSTHEAGATCPPPPDRSRGYVWPIYDSYDVWAGNPDGSNLVNLTQNPGYDAEATMAQDGSRIVFTSTRDGDLEIYTMAPDGSDVRRLTTTPGYDGGAFFSADGKKIIYRAHHPEGANLEEYRALLAAGLVRPSQMEIFIMNADGSDARALTDNGYANFAPFMHPDGKRVLFASNLGSQGGREFDIYMVNVDGTGLEQITYAEQFDGFPMFSADGRQLVFCSNRFNGKPGDTNVFIADWVD
ncbi:MAG: TolB family protein [Planctomycetota bacterium]